MKVALEYALENTKFDAKNGCVKGMGKVVGYLGPDVAEVRKKRQSLSASLLLRSMQYETERLPITQW